jgi:hypothetical protein
MKSKSRARRTTGRGARKPQRPKGEFSQEGKGEIRRLRERERKLNEGRKHEFPLDTAGHYILVSYKPTKARSKGRSRIAFFDSNLRDAERVGYETTRRLYDAVAALERGAVGPQLRSWLAVALRRLADQVNQTKPDWDARIPFGIPQSMPRRPANAAWTQPFLALDVEFGRAAGQTTEEAIEKTAKAWRQGNDVVEKAHQKWHKACRRIVSTVTREDIRDGFSSADTTADHQAGLRLFWADHARVGPGR